MYKYISLIVSVFCSGLSAQSQTVSFLHSIPLGLLLGFLICPLFPLNSPGYFPKNTSAPFVVFLFFSPQAWAHFLLWTHVENTRLSTQCVHFPNDIVPTLVGLSRMNAKWQFEHDDKESHPVIAVLIFPGCNQATSRLHITPAIRLVKLLCGFLSVTACLIMLIGRCLWRGRREGEPTAGALCKSILYCAADVVFLLMASSTA